MRLLFKQRFSFGFDKYDIYNEQGETVFTVKGRFSFGRKLEVYDRGENLVGVLEGRVFQWMPTFDIYIGDRICGRIKKKFTFFKPEFSLECDGWSISGNFFEYDYSINDAYGKPVARIEKEIAWMDKYHLDIFDDTNVLKVLMVVIAIDAEKDDRNNSI